MWHSALPNAMLMHSEGFKPEQGASAESVVSAYALSCACQLSLDGGSREKHA